jgi:DegV family protein with EDD domain
MSAIHIITDSCANFLRLPPDPRVTVVPNRITIGSRTFREGVDITHEEAVKLIARSKTPPRVVPPTEAEYARAYNHALQEHTAVVSIHASREIYASWYNARKASQPLAAHSPVAVIDSQTICTAQGMLVENALRMLDDNLPFETVVRRVRSSIERIYAIYYTETTEYLFHSRILNPSHGILGAMLGIKPFLSLENGVITPIEKVRSRSQAIDRLVEFSVEFDNIEQAVIIQSRSGAVEATRMLQERLAVEFPGREFPVMVVAASMAALIGPDVNGLVILESEDSANGASRD